MIDPGPDDPAHLRRSSPRWRATNGVGAILVTHSHLDHSPLARRLGAVTGRGCFGRRSVVVGPQRGDGAAGGCRRGRGRRGRGPRLRPDDANRGGVTTSPGGWAGSTCWRHRGHMAKPPQFRMAGRAVHRRPRDGLVHLAGVAARWRHGGPSWPPAAGCRAATIVSTTPAHGDPIPRSAGPVDRTPHPSGGGREAQIMAALGAQGPATAEALARRIYTDVSPTLLPAAARNVLAHLIDLHDKKRDRDRGCPDRRRALFPAVTVPPRFFSFPSGRTESDLLYAAPVPA